MASTPIMNFKRYDGVTHTLKIPTAAYTAGATLRFTAKPSIDNDGSNAAAVINKSFTDANIISTTGGYVTYSLPFVGNTDITNVSFLNGEDDKQYEGEFKYIVSGKPPVTYPGDNEYIEVHVFANVQVGTT